SSTPLDLGQISANTMSIDASYALTRKASIDFGAPYVASKYDGSAPHVPTLDDGAFHGAMQDLRLAMRYQLVSGRTAVTPFAAVSVPSHSYAYFAHSAVGRDLREFSVGAFAAHIMDEVVPGAFVQAKYSYSFTQQVLDIPHNHSNLDLELGYFINPRLRTFGLAAGQVTHGGLDAGPDYVFTPEQWQHHDQIVQSNFVAAGAGGAFSMNDSMDVFGSFMRDVYVKNGHAIARSVTFGVSWTIDRRGGARGPMHEARREKGALVRCTCQKAG
ncbi:MAG TPA: hypothetical protein VEU08_04460, partial [Vicinamibacterales bacterium]|nr:hypothetical protein [Vicinamibacterales bacterium]